MPRSRRRVWIRRLLILGILLGGVWWVLRGGFLESYLLSRANRALEESLGCRLEAEVGELRPFAGRLELRNVRLVDASDLEVASAQRVSGDLRVLALLGRTLDLVRVELQGVRFDVGRALELQAEERAGGSGAGWQVQIRELVVSEGELSGLTLSQAGAPWPSSASLHELSLEGSLVDGQLVASIREAVARIERPQGDPVSFSVLGRIAGPREGPLELSGVELAGDLVELNVAGTVGLSADQPMRLELDGELDAGRWLDPSRSASISGRGEIDLRAERAELRFESDGVPIGLAEPWVDLAALASVVGPADLLVLDGELVLGPGAYDRVSGRLQGTLTRADEALARLALEPTPVAEGGHTAPFRLAVLPDLEGRREAAGVVALADWSLDGMSFAEGSLDVTTSEVGSMLGHLVARWPELIAAPPAALRGPVTVRGSFAGPLTAPTVDLTADWETGTDAGVRASFEGAPLEVRGRLEAQIRSLALGSLDAELDGLLTGELELDNTQRPVGRFDAYVLDLRAGDVESADVEARGSLEGETVRVSRLKASWNDHEVEAQGTVAATADGVRIALDPVSLDGVRANVEAEVPGALVPEVPILTEGRWRTAAAQEREVRLRWELPRADVGRLASPGSDRLDVASSGELWLQLDAPAASRGELSIGSLEWLHDDWIVRSPEALELTLGEGRLTCAACRLEAEESFVDGALTLELADGWRFGQPFTELIESYAVDGRSVVGADWVAEALGLDDLDGTLTVRFDTDRDRIQVHLEGDGSSFRLRPAGSVPVASPSLELLMLDEGWSLTSLEARVAESAFRATGSGSLAPAGLGIDRLEASLGDVTSRWIGFVPFSLDDAAGPSEPFRVEWHIPEVELAELLAPFDLLREDESLRAGASGELRFLPSDLQRATGFFEVTGLEWRADDRLATTEGPLRVTIGSGQVELEPLVLLSEQQRFELSGRARLAPSWEPEASLATLVTDLAVRGDGTLLTSVLQPFLSGSVGEGFLEVELEAAGPPRELTGTLRVEGPEAALAFARPYATQISDPSFGLVLDRGGITSLGGKLGLNDGTVKLSGGRIDEGGAQLRAELEEVRYRLDYGLLTMLNGQVDVNRTPVGEWSIVGDVTVENGLLTRDIDLDLGLVQELLAPVDLSSTEESPLEAFALDVTLRTAEGIRVRNNVADALVRWEPVRVRGNLAAPVLDGRFEVEPGGRIRAFGQTVRIDSASLDYPGVRDLPATLELETTSSLEDPSISNLASKDPFASASELEESEEDRLAAAASGLGTFYGERLANRVTQSLSGATVSFEPILIFGEADPGTRLTVSQPFSPQVTVAASVDLRNAEQRTYVLDLHNLDQLPGLQAQAFTRDEKTRGGAVRQRVRLGPGGKPREDGPKIRKLRFDLPRGIKKRRIKRSLGLGKGDRLVAGSLFAAEVGVNEYLRGRGWTDARTELAVEEVSRGVAVVVAVEPGPHTTFAFEGDRLPRALRGLVTGIYRSDYYEATAIEEMKDEARRALRSLGYLGPEVRVRVDPTDPTNPSGDRRVTIALDGGRRVDLETILFEPLPDEEAAVLFTRFSKPVRRIELAAGLPEADRRVRQTLEYLGYSKPRIVERHLSDDGSSLRVVIETGTRPTLSAIEVEGVAPDEAQRLVELSGLSVGDPARPDRVASAVVAIRDDLRARSYADARVEPHVERVEGRPEARRLRLEVDPGDSYFVSEVAFTGLESTRAKFATRVAGIDPESDYTDESVSEARKRLWKTRAFESVTSESARAPGGNVRLNFDVTERKRFELGYGVRWDNDTGIGLLTELIDRNVLGRAWTVGLRALWSEDDQELRAFGGLPRLWNSRSSLGLFAAVREESESGLLTDTLEGTVQLSYQLSRRLTARLYGRYTETRVREEVPLDPDFPFDQRATRPVLGTQFIFDERRGQLLFQKGLFASLDFSVSDEYLGSDFRYSRLYGQAAYFLNLKPRSSRSLIWAQSIRVGLADPRGDQQLVLDDRFFAGGEFSVRGYLTESLGPQEMLGDIRIATGGEALLIINEEMRLELTKRLIGLVFFDAGNVFDEVGDLSFDVVTSAGLGLRALTPIGLLRLDLAHALDRRPFDPEFKVYFGFGTTF